MKTSVTGYATFVDTTSKVRGQPGSPRELGFLNLAEKTWEAFRAANAYLPFGTERGVEVDEDDARMVKITLPP